MEESLQDHSGFALYDIENEAFLIEYQSHQYFTPASNTKIFTMFTAMNIIGEKMPGLYYRESGDSLIFWGTGDPSFLYENVFQNGAVFNFLKNAEKDLYFSSSNFKDERFGPNWSWDDYLYSYQVERSSFPIYGNYFIVSKEKGKRTLQLNIDVFKKYFWLQDSLSGKTPIIRDLGSNLTEYFPQDLEAKFEKEVPFRYSDLLLAELLTDTLKRKVKVVETTLDNAETLYSIPTDSLFRVLMQDSDNHIAEQLLLTCSGIISDTLRSSIAIDYALTKLLGDLPDKPLWYDGSGLSRYNQFTPAAIATLWAKIIKMKDKPQLFPLLATGGEFGTLKNYYKAEKPYIFGKTGTLRNNHSLSGFIQTDSGRILSFSFMNSHYPGSSNDCKVHMEKILKIIKSSY